MKLRPLYFLGLLGVSALQTDCVLVCNDDSCENTLELLDWCAISDVCRVNGQLVTTCEEGASCPFDEIIPGTLYEIPLEKLWPTLGSRNDLEFNWWDGNLGEDGDVLVTFDGVPATDSVCKREFRSHVSIVTCSNLPHSLKRLAFEFIPPTSGISGDIGMQLYASDSECLQAHIEECN